MGKKVICFGEVLWDDFGETKTIGGAPLNVCYHLSKLNIDAAIVSQVGKDPLGETILKQLVDWKIDARYCRTTDKYPTSTVNINLMPGGDVKYSITEEVAWDFIVYDEHLAKEIETCEAFVYGTLAARNPVSRKVLLDYVKVAKWPVLDLNLRQPYCDPNILIPLIKASRSIKLNQEELVFVTQILHGFSAHERDAVDIIFESFDNIGEIILTKGGAGAAYYNRNEHLEIRGVPVNVMDTVGSGDSFLAAFIGGKLSGKANNQILKDAIMLSAFMATRKGGCPAYTLMELENFKDQYYDKE